MSLVINTNITSINSERSGSAAAAELKPPAAQRLPEQQRKSSVGAEAADGHPANQFQRRDDSAKNLSTVAKIAGEDLSLLAEIEKATDDVTGLLHRMRELTIQAVYDAKGSQDRQALNNEVQELKAEIDRISQDTLYGERSALADLETRLSTDAIRANSSDTVGLDTTALAIEAVEVTSVGSASDALTAVSSAMATVAGARADQADLHGRLENVVSNLIDVTQYTAAMRTKIEDADFAMEIARSAKAQMLQQTGTTILAQANASQQLALSLFR